MFRRRRLRHMIKETSQCASSSPALRWIGSASSRTHSVGHRRPRLAARTPPPKRRRHGRRGAAWRPERLDVLRAGASTATGSSTWPSSCQRERGCDTDRRKASRRCHSLAGSGKPLVVSGGTLVRPDDSRPKATSSSPPGRSRPHHNMQAALAAADRGVRSCLVMLPARCMRGGRHGFVPSSSPWPDQGRLALRRRRGGRWPAVQ